MTLSDKDAWDLINKIGDSNTQQRATRVAAARAASVGKEAFDLAKLETLCDTSSDGRLDTTEVRKERFEYMYYVDFPNIVTLEELARRVEELNKW